MVASVLDRLHAAAWAEDEPAKERVRAREAQLGVRLAQAQRYEFYGDAPLATKHEVGELLYVLASSGRVRRIVEFGASLEHVRDPARGYVSICVPLDAGVELSVRVLPGPDGQGGG